MDPALEPPGMIPVVVAFGATSVAHAAETITYTYDAKGRLVRVVPSK
ncbi:MAG: hypothetical protein EOP83_00050, partial [Verrucomicrobiaceae bacterium]